LWSLAKLLINRFFRFSELNFDSLRINHDFPFCFSAIGDQEQPHLQTRKQNLMSNIMTAGYAKMMRKDKNIGKSTILAVSEFFIMLISEE